MAVSLEFLSNTTNGGLVKITSTVGGGSGNALHTATNVADEIDVITLRAYNSHTADVELTVEFGGTTSDDQVKVTIPFKDGIHVVIPAGILAGGKTVSAFAATANVIYIEGDVHRYS